VRVFAADTLTSRVRLAALGSEIRHPDTAAVLSTPGMGATLTAEFLAEAGD
jgi:hypothetical protein